MPFLILKYQLYILQLEEYDLKRFTKSLANKGLLRDKSLRKDLVWSAKARILFSLTLFQQLLLAIAVSYLLFNEVTIIILSTLLIYFIASIFSFFFLAISMDLIYPFEVYRKNKIIQSAKQKMKSYEGIVVGITGSYGKTTMKEIVATVLSEKFSVVKTEGNNNTPLGISKTIMEKFKPNTEVFVVEMGEYVKGDVKALCEIVKPDIAIITGINEAHLERYGSMENAISTKFEIIENSKPGSFCILNGDDELVIGNYHKYSSGHEISFYSSQSQHQFVPEFEINNYEFDQSGKGQSFEVSFGEEDLGRFKTSLIGEYAVGNIIASIILCRHLKMNNNEIRIGVSKISQVKHRLSTTLSSQNILIIDDTYNGNSDGIRQGINLLKKFSGRRKVYVTPGLVETGSQTKEIHLKIGQDLSKVADLVILIRNSVTNFIEMGLQNGGFDPKDIIFYETSKEAYSSLQTHLKPDDVVLMQNDWSDNYY
jgi:UDP-N-acetylmuramoyl-tripeptide--D-alanyl-D-alanine ligase